VAFSPARIRRRNALGGLFAGLVLGFALMTAAQTSIVPASAVNGAGVSTQAITLPTVVFAALPTSADGTLIYCSDCASATPATCPATQASCICAASGTGAVARRIASTWYCTR
jgi:hypothetical protein